MVEFKKCFSIFIISITLFNNLAVKIKFYVVEVINIRTHSSKTNKLRNINTIGRGARNIYIKKWEIYYFKIKIIQFIINFRRNYAISYWQVQV